jgi:Protein of unknown function (DUF5818)
MKRTQSLLIAATLWAVFSPQGFSQGTTQPSQPVDPTAQTPGAPIPTTPPTFPAPKAKGDSAASTTTSASGSPQEKLRPFVGTVVPGTSGYVLRAGDLEYKLENQDQAKPYSGKSVKVTGSLDRKSNTIRVRKIELLPAS